jgi:hypothetical protein
VPAVKRIAVSPEGMPTVACEPIEDKSRNVADGGNHVDAKTVDLAGWEIDSRVDSSSFDDAC